MNHFAPSSHPPSYLPTYFIMSATLKQGKLAFASAKRTTSSSKIGKPTTSTTTSKPAPKESLIPKSKTLEDKSDDEIVLGSSDDDDTLEEFDDIEAVSSKSDVETRRSEDEEEIEEAPTPPPVERKTRSSTRKTHSKVASKTEVGPSTEAANVGVFRVSNARPEDVAKKVEANARKEDAGGIPELNHKDLKWRKHHNEVKEKMGHMHTSESSRAPIICAVVNFATQSMVKNRTRYTISFVFLTSGFTLATAIYILNI